MDNAGVIIAIKADEKGLIAGIKVSENAIKHFSETVSEHFKNIKNSWISLGVQTAVYTTALKNVAGAVQSYIIAPLSGAVNAFVSFGDQLAKTSQRVGAERWTPSKPFRNSSARQGFCRCVERVSSSAPGTHSSRPHSLGVS